MGRGLQVELQKIRHPSARDREPACQERIYKSERGLNDISGLSKSCQSTQSQLR
jgi:hypothetical protein